VTPAEIVLDASVLVRGLVRESDHAVDLLTQIGDGTIVTHAPDLIDPETANALLQLVRAGRSTRSAAETMLRETGELPLQRYPTARLALPALHLALEIGVSAYDGFYALLSRLLDLPLVTADRRLAAALPNAILVA